jgi:hypothetical protein
MITYRNPLWNTLIQFLKELKDYPPFQENANGRIKNTVEGIYNRACKHAKITDRDWKEIFLTHVLPYLRENPQSDDVEVFKYIEETNFDKLCLTNKDGFELFDAAKKEMAEAKENKDKQLEYEKTYHDYLAKKEAHDKYIAEQEKTRKELEEAEKKLQEVQNKINPTIPELSEEYPTQVEKEIVSINTNNNKVRANKK